MTTIDVATIKVEWLAEPRAIKMVWGSRVEELDMYTAFRWITDELNRSMKPVDVILDIRGNLNFSLRAIILESLIGPFKSTYKGRWLIIGTNRGAKLLTETLVKMVSPSASVRQVATDTEALAWLER